MMILTLDNLAHRYQCLPSEALARASTFDLYVLDVSTKWSNYQRECAEGIRVDHKHSQEELMAMLQQARSQA